MTLDAVRGQDRAIRFLTHLLESGDVPGALLFRGPEGVGKRTAAVAFAKALNDASSPVDPDLHIVDAAYQAQVLGEDAEKQRTIKIDVIRHLIRDLEMRSMHGRWKAAVIEDAHKLMPAAANAMLKSLEEPPPRTVWILVTHRPAELLPTILSRCQGVPFGTLDPATISEILAARGADGKRAEQAATLAEGSVARAIELAEIDAPDIVETLSDPLAPFQMADALPRELHRSRPVVEDQLRRMAWAVRQARGHRSYSSAPSRTVLRELGHLRGALRSNADPRLVLQIAALRMQQLKAVGGLTS